MLIKKGKFSCETELALILCCLFNLWQDVVLLQKVIKEKSSFLRPFGIVFYDFSTTAWNINRSRMNITFIKVRLIQNPLSTNLAL